MLFLRLDEDHPSRCATVTFASAKKVLQPMLGCADKPVIVAMTRGDRRRILFRVSNGATRAENNKYR
jgi:hypothetical protein